MAERIPNSRTVWFGHVADSNLHLMASHDTLSKDVAEEIVYETVREWKGSISAEHGIGTLKKPYLGFSRSPEELELMRTLKAALDPRGILNPGKIFD